MFEWTPPRDKFRMFAWAVVALIMLLFVEFAAIKPYQHWRFERAQQALWPDSTKCSTGPLASPDRKYVVYADSCYYQDSGTVVAVYAMGEPEGETYQTTNAILNMKSGGPVYVTWKTNRDLLVVCRHCRESDAYFVKRQFRDITIQFRFEGYNEPLPGYVTGATVGKR